jgi:hypothetical protein
MCFFLACDQNPHDQKSNLFGMGFRTSDVAYQMFVYYVLSAQNILSVVKFRPYDLALKWHIKCSVIPRNIRGIC